MKYLNPTISTVHRIEIEVPEDFYRAHGHTKEYEQASLKFASDANVDSGQDACSSVIEWAESTNRNDLDKWAKSWSDFIEMKSNDLVLVARTAAPKP